MNKTSLVFVVALLASSVLHAAVIDVGVHNIGPNTITSVPISIRPQSGDPSIAGMNLAVQIGDGTGGPVIKSVNLDSNTLFDGNNTGSIDQGSLSRQAFWRITTATGAVPVIDGIIATLEIDATGLTEGSFALTLSSVLGAPTELLSPSATPIDLTVNDGQINIIPEPTSALLLGVGGILLGSRRRGSARHTCVAQ